MSLLRATARSKDEESVNYKPSYTQEISKQSKMRLSPSNRKNLRSKNCVICACGKFWSSKRDASKGKKSLKR